MGGELKVTYGVLFDLLMREKSREELQALDASFFNDVVDYLEEKKNIAGQNKDSLFSDSEKEKTEHQIKNIKKILKELYERREKKILNMAINKSRIKTQLIDSNALLEEERKLFEMLVFQLDYHRMHILGNLLQGKHPQVDVVAVEEVRKAEVIHEVARTADQETEQTSIFKETKLVRFLSPMPRFAGTELEVYGPFDVDDMAALPAEIADLLIRKERAEEMTDEL